jgi:hypothetical protein
MYISLYSVVQNTSYSVLQLIVIKCSIIELPYGLYSFPDATRHRVTLSTPRVIKGYIEGVGRIVVVLSVLS